MTAEYKVHGDVAVITMNNPPVNGLGHATRVGMTAGLAKANADAAVKAIVITGAGKAFSGGADIKEFGTPKALQEPNLLSVILAVENSSQAGGGRRALRGHGRRAGTGAGLPLPHRGPGLQVALPEVKLGLIPGAGGTQRLPRVLGVEVALNMIVSGEPVKSEMLAQLPGQKLFDKMAASAESLMEEAWPSRARWPMPARCRWCATCLASTRWAMRTSSSRATWSRACRRTSRRRCKCVDAVEAATKKKFDDGMVAEREIFIALMFTPECRALRHLFVAERAASKIPDVPDDTPKREIKSVAVIGAGTMGGGISMNFLNAGIPVKILEMKQEALDRGVATIRKNYEAQVKKGKLKQDKYDQRMALLSTTLSYDDLKDADLVIEAVFEEMGVKEKVFKELDRVMKPGAILASNTSTLDVNKIASSPSARRTWWACTSSARPT
jgi:3-hydroxyacyl-CoA dehydrogenase